MIVYVGLAPVIYVVGPENHENVRGVSGAYALFTICIAV